MKNLIKTVFYFSILSACMPVLLITNAYAEYVDPCETAYKAGKTWQIRQRANYTYENFCDMEGQITLYLSSTEGYKGHLSLQPVNSNNCTAPNVVNTDIYCSGLFGDTIYIYEITSEIYVSRTLEGTINTDGVNLTGYTILKSAETSRLVPVPIVINNI